MENTTNYREAADALNALDATREKPRTDLGAALKECARLGLSPVIPDASQNHIYVSLFHGRKDSKEDLSDWGFDGPVIGPVDVCWTYGTLKLCETFGNGFEELPIDANELVSYCGKFYGDFDMITNPATLAKLRADGREFHDFATFRANLSK